MRDVVTFGEILWDIFEEGRLEDGAMAKSLRPALGGASANLAVGLARLGVKVALVGAVGDDRFGTALVRALAAEGVDTRFVRPLPARTGITFVRHTKGQPTFLPYRQGTADGLLEAEDVTPAMGKARFAVVDTSALRGPRLPGATNAFLAAASAGKARVVVDLNVRPHLWSSVAAMKKSIAGLVGHAAVVKASAVDLEHLAGARGLAWLRAHAPDALHVVTRGPGSASAYGAFGEVVVPARAVREVDATGAGDAFLAGLLAIFLAHGRSWLDGAVVGEALAAGHVMGAKAVGARGATKGLVGLAALKRALATNSRLAKGTPVR